MSVSIATHSATPSDTIKLIVDWNMISSFNKMIRVCRSNDIDHEGEDGTCQSVLSEPQVGKHLSRSYECVNPLSTLSMRPRYWRCADLYCRQESVMSLMKFVWSGSSWHRVGVWGESEAEGKSRRQFAARPPNQLAR